MKLFCTPRSSNFANFGVFSPVLSHESIRGSIQAFYTIRRDGRRQYQYSAALPTVLKLAKSEKMWHINFGSAFIVYCFSRSVPIFVDFGACSTSQKYQLQNPLFRFTGEHSYVRSDSGALPRTVQQNGVRDDPGAAPDGGASCFCLRALWLHE